LQTKRPVTAYFDVFAVIAKNSTYWPHGIGNTWGGLAWERTKCQMISIYTGETTFGHVLAQTGATAHTGLVFHRLTDKRQTLFSPSKRSSSL
jgi:hypothetical protein